MQTKLDALFRPDGNGSFRLYLHHRPVQDAPLGCLLFVQPWAEEANKCRRFIADLARALAAQGWATLVIDLLGCGDSSGDFGDAGWQNWIDDVQSGATWLRDQHPLAPFWLGGVRAGALLAAQVAPRLAWAVNLLFVQPVHNGRQHLQQFLRLADAARWAGGTTASDSRELREKLAAGLPIDVAGYRIGPALAEGLSRSTLTPAAGYALARLCWVDASALDCVQASPATLALIGQWREAGWSVDFEVAHGPSFWQATEIEEAPKVVQAVQRQLAAAAAAT